MLTKANRINLVNNTFVSWRLIGISAPVFPSIRTVIRIAYRFLQLIIPLALKNTKNRPDSGTEIW